MPSLEFFGRNYSVPDDHLLIATRAVKSEVNANFDEFPFDELKNAAHTYDGCDLVFVEHTYVKTDDDSRRYDDGIDRSRSRGYVVANHFDDEEGELYLLIAIDKRYHDLCRYILDGSLGAVSMGCTCDTFCSECGSEFNEVSPCECGACPNMIGSIGSNGTPIHDILRNISFYEISIVQDPASESASFYDVAE